MMLDNPMFRVSSIWASEALEISKVTQDSFFKLG